MGKITFGEVSVRDTDLDSQDAFVVAERVSNVGGLRVSARRGFPIAIAARGATNGDIRLDGQLGVLFGTRELGHGRKDVGRESPARLIVEGTPVREERRANGLVDNRAFRRFLEYGAEHASNGVAIADIFDGAAHAM